MRITGGTFGGIRLDAPRNIRPTQDRVREALFSIIGDRIPGSRFLDLFAGSGAVGLEALSRGAGFVCWVEKNPSAVRTLKGNVSRICGDNRSAVNVVAGDAARFVRKPPGEVYDIIFADPPYDKSGAGRGHAAWTEKQMGPVIEETGRNGMLKGGGMLIIEQYSRCRPIDYPGWRLTDRRVYGETALRFLEQVPAPV